MSPGPSTKCVSHKFFLKLKWSSRLHYCLQLSPILPCTHTLCYIGLSQSLMRNEVYTSNPLTLSSAMWLWPVECGVKIGTISKSKFQEPLHVSVCCLALWPLPWEGYGWLELVCHRRGWKTHRAELAKVSCSSPRQSGWKSPPDPQTCDWMQVRPVEANLDWTTLTDPTDMFQFPTTAQFSNSVTLTILPELIKSRVRNLVGRSSGEGKVAAWFLQPHGL